MSQPIKEEQIQGEVFLNQDEQYLCAAGSTQLERFLAKGRLGSGFAVLSDRAIYCKGRCSVSRDRRRYTTQKTDFRIDLEEFQDVKYVRRKKPFLLSLACFFLLLGPSLLLLDKAIGFGKNIVLNPLLDAAICILLAGIFFLLYSIHQKTFLELLHTNGAICLDEKPLPDKEERLLIRYLRAYLKSRENEPPELTEL